MSEKKRKDEKRKMPSIGRIFSLYSSSSSYNAIKAGKREKNISQLLCHHS